MYTIHQVFILCARQFRISNVYSRKVAPKLVNTVGRLRGLQGKIHIFIENYRFARISTVKSKSAHQTTHFEVVWNVFQKIKNNILKTS